MNIRNYDSSDYQEVVSTLKESDLFDDVWDSEKNLNGITSKDSSNILVAEEDGTIIGNVFIVRYGNEVSYLFRLAVKKGFRQKGVASALIEKAEAVIKLGGSAEVGLYVDSGNINLQEFYKKRGFRISPKTYHYMWKQL